jgi:hypothetical protein
VSGVWRTGPLQAKHEPTDLSNGWDIRIYGGPRPHLLQVEEARSLYADLGRALAAAAPPADDRDRPTLTFDAESPLPGHPFVLTVPLDDEELIPDEELIVFLTGDEVEALAADGMTALVAARRAQCATVGRHEYQEDRLVDDGPGVVLVCLYCPAEAIRHDDGTVVAVGERS